MSQHYSPRAELIYLLKPEREEALEDLVQMAKKAVGDGRSVGMLLVEEDIPALRDLPVQVASLGTGDDLWQAAHRLYAGMRSLDEQQVDLILARDLGDQGPGLALRDRLRRAARQVIAH